MTSNMNKQLRQKHSVARGVEYWFRCRLRYDENLRYFCDAKQEKYMPVSTLDLLEMAKERVKHNEPRRHKPYVTEVAGMVLDLIFNDKITPKK